MMNDTKWLKRALSKEDLPFIEFLKVVRSFNAYYGGKGFNVEPLAFHGRFNVSKPRFGVYLVMSHENPREHYIFNIRRPGLPNAPRLSW